MRSSPLYLGMAGEDMHLREIVDRHPPPPMALWNADLSRIAHRFQGLASVHRSTDYKLVLQHLPHLRPPSPRPEKHNWQSKRDWEREMQSWRHALANLANDVPTDDS